MEAVEIRSRAIDPEDFARPIPEPEPVPFPLEGLPDLIRQLAVQVAEKRRIRPALPAAAALVAISAAIGRSVVGVRASSSGPVCANLFALGVARSSGGKSSCAEVLDPFIRYFCEDMVAERNHRHGKLMAEKEIIDFQIRRDKQKAARGDVESEVELHGLVEKRNGIERDLRRDPAYWTSNATSEAIALEMSQGDGAVLSFSDEASELVRILRGLYRKGVPDTSFYNGAWSGTPVSVSRATRERVEIPNPCLSILWAIQPVYLKELFDGGLELVHSGLLGRILLVNADFPLQEDDGVLREVEPKLAEEWGDLIRRLLGKRFAASKPRELSFADEARDFLRVAHNQYVRKMNATPKIEAIYGKARENAARIALLLSVSTGKAEVGLSEVQAALGIVEYSIANIENLLMTAEREKASETARRIEEAIRAGNGEVRLRDLKDRNNISREEVEEVVKLYPSRFRIVEKNSKGVGRKSLVVRMVENLEGSIDAAQWTYST